jgi:hypothetical protein
MLPELESPFETPRLDPHRYHTTTIHGDDGARAVFGEPRSPIGKRWCRVIFDHKYGRAGEQVAQWRRGVCIGCEVEYSANPAPFDLEVGVTRPFENKSVMAITVIRTDAAESLVGKYRDSQGVSQLDGHIQRRILVTAHAVVHPVEYELPGGWRCSLKQSRSLAKVCWQSAE